MLYCMLHCAWNAPICILRRTKAAFRVAKERDVKLGTRSLVRGFDTAMTRTGRTVRSELASKNAADVLPFILAAQKAGASSLREVAAALTAGVFSPREATAGTREWCAGSWGGRSEPSTAPVRMVVAPTLTPRSRTRLFNNASAERQGNQRQHNQLAQHPRLQ